MANVNGIVVKSNCELIQSVYTASDNCKLNLNPKDIYNIGIDPSTTNLGLYICNEDETVHGIFQLKNYNGPRTAEKFASEVAVFLKNNVQGLQINNVVTEVPFQGGGYYSSAKSLLSFLGALKNYFFFIPELKDKKINEIQPMVWKSKIIDKSKGKNRHRNKQCTAEDLCDRFPCLKPMYDRFNQSSDYDAFDACGVYHGWKIKFGLNSNGTRSIGGDKKYSKVALLALKYFDSNEVANMYSPLFCIKGILGQPVLKNYNENETLYDNIKRSLNDNFSTTVITDQHTLLSLLWELNLDFDPNKVLCMHILPNTKINKALKQYLVSLGYSLTVYY